MGPSNKIRVRDCLSRVVFETTTSKIWHCRHGVVDHDTYYDQGGDDDIVDHLFPGIPSEANGHDAATHDLWFDTEDAPAAARGPLRWMPVDAVTGPAASDFDLLRFDFGADGSLVAADVDDAIEFYGADVVEHSTSVATCSEFSPRICIGGCTVLTTAARVLIRAYHAAVAAAQRGHGHATFAGLAVPGWTDAAEAVPMTRAEFEAWEPDLSNLIDDLPDSILCDHIDSDVVKEFHADAE